MVILGIGFVLLGRVHNLWQFYLAFVVMSLGAGLGTWMPMMTVLNSWFLRRRSTAMAVAMEGFPWVAWRWCRSWRGRLTPTDWDGRDGG